MAKRIRVKIGDRWYEVEVGDISANPIHVLVDGETVEVNVEGLTEAILPGDTPSQLPEGRMVQVRSPMPGVIVSVGVEPGQSVAEGDALCILEAIKLQQAIRAPASGMVRAVHVAPGESVTAGHALVDLG